MRMLYWPLRSPPSASNRLPGKAAKSLGDVADSRRPSLRRAGRLIPENPLTCATVPIADNHSTWQAGLCVTSSIIVDNFPGPAILLHSNGIKSGKMKTLPTALAILLPAFGQLADEYKPPRANCCLQFTAQGLADQLQDWNQLGRYHADNERVKALPADPKRVVFYGDSITDGWRLAEYFPNKPYVNRGIGGQTTSQMLVRLFPDVIDLKPGAMILLAGTNDIARNTGPVTLKMIAENVQAMTELAQLHGIKVILCALLPISDYTQANRTIARPPADILKLNAWLKEYAAKVKAGFVDYHKALLDEKGFLKDGFARDGLHPNDKGYQVMAPLAQQAIDQMLR